MTRLGRFDSKRKRSTPGSGASCSTNQPLFEVPKEHRPSPAVGMPSSSFFRFTGVTPLPPSPDSFSHNTIHPQVRGGTPPRTSTTTTNTAAPLCLPRRPLRPSTCGLGSGQPTPQQLARATAAAASTRRQDRRGERRVPAFVAWRLIVVAVRQRQRGREEAGRRSGGGEAYLERGAELVHRRRTRGAQCAMVLAERERGGD